LNGTKNRTFQPTVVLFSRGFQGLERNRIGKTADFPVFFCNALSIHREFYGEITAAAAAAAALAVAAAAAATRVRR
jgi:hypothetical protein